MFMLVCVCGDAILNVLNGNRKYVRLLLDVFRFTDHLSSRICENTQAHTDIP